MINGGFLHGYGLKGNLGRKLGVNWWWLVSWALQSWDAMAAQLWARRVRLFFLGLGGGGSVAGLVAQVNISRLQFSKCKW